MKKDIWYRGERIELTGKSQELYGTTFYEFQYLTGHKQGKKEVMSKRQRAELVE